jgi:hypothetical protein
MSSLRIATWNTKQGVAPRQKTPALWEWISRDTEAQLLVLTEARDFKPYCESVGTIKPTRRKRRRF